MINVIKVLNTVSIFLFTVVLMVVYLYLPIMVELGISEVGDLHKQTFFYYVFSGFIGVNILIKIAITWGNRSLSSNLTSWIYLIIFVVNFYFATIIGFIGVLNNQTSIDPENYLYLNYLGPTFMIIWVVGFIFFTIKKSYNSLFHHF